MREILWMAALFASAIGALLFYQHRLGEAKVKSELVHEDSAPPVVAQPLKSQPALPTQLLWTQDERWQLAKTEGAALLEQMRELYRWQEEVGGDPLRFRSEKKEIYEKLEPILEKLIGLKSELVGHPGATGLIEQRIREFSKALSGVLR
jgi:hypothetical protein